MGLNKKKGKEDKYIPLIQISTLTRVRREVFTMSVHLNKLFLETEKQKQSAGHAAECNNQFSQRSLKAHIKEHKDAALFSSMCLEFEEKVTVNPKGLHRFGIDDI